METLVEVAENNTHSANIQKNSAFPVQLLRDGKGIYGIGIVDNDDRLQPVMILRPDRLSEGRVYCAALQMIPAGSEHMPFHRMLEECMRALIHFGMLARKGVDWPRDDWGRWTGDPAQRARNRNMYHGLKRASRKVANRLISEALKAADRDALTLARRFRLNDRNFIYHATAQSRRAFQLTETFPALGVAIFGKDSYRPDNPRIQEAARLVEAGARLKKVAKLMGIPMSYRRVKPGAANLALAVVDAIDPRLVEAHMPKSLPKMRIWLRCIDFAKDFGPDFVHWTARHALEIGGSYDESVSFLRDVTDWLRACYRAAIERDRRLQQGEQFVVRRFNPNMSLATVTKLSGDWHEAVGANMSGSEYEFPEPWCPGGQSGGFDIVPITNSSELYREGNLMHHCVGTYADRVLFGASYIFSVRKDNEHIATLELIKKGASVEIGQLRGACNRKAPEEVMFAVKSWLRSQRGFRSPPNPDILAKNNDDEALMCFEAVLAGDVE